MFALTSSLLASFVYDCFPAPLPVPRGVPAVDQEAFCVLSTQSVPILCLNLAKTLSVTIQEALHSFHTRTNFPSTYGAGGSHRLPSSDCRMGVADEVQPKVCRKTMI